MSPAAVGPPVWSSTTRSASRSRPRRSMVRTKLAPWDENTQEVRRMACRPPAARTPILARQLRAAVGAERTCRIGRLPGGLARAVEDVIGRDVQERHAFSRRRAGHGGGGGAVDHGRQRLLLLGAVDGRVGGGVDHRLGVGGQDRGGAGLGVREIGAVAAECHDRRAGGEFAGDLAGLAEDEDPHARAPSRAPTPSRSWSARHQGSLARNQSTVRASPCSSVTEGRQPSSVRMRVGSMA